MATIHKLNSVRPELKWTPIEGAQTRAFLDRKSSEIPDKDALQKVLFESQTILGRCVPPTNETGRETGLVVGYVQSGKTLSFTTVTALARDNEYRLVIIIAGTGVILKSQSEQRLIDDLGINASTSEWAHFDNPDPSGEDANSIGNALEKWRRPGLPAHRRRTVLITVLKNHAQLKKLIRVISRLKLDGAPTLVIDDEADQASLNTKTALNRRRRRAEKSTTYDRITQLLGCIPHHTFLQYTATPQANLLLDIQDVLDPAFAETIEPGKDYLGGADVFRDKSPLVEIIPANHIPSPTNVVSTAPSSLLDAIRVFLLGAAHHYVTCGSGNRSMMVHPSQSTGRHADYRDWIRRSTDAWKKLLEHTTAPRPRKDCAEQFRKAYVDLAATYPDLSEFDKLIDVMPEVIGDTRIAQVNTAVGGQKIVKWKSNDYWILVGGTKLDRGFTVEGLTVTYMPRSLGTGNADTVQQRARFFGYKKPIAGLCRVYLPADVRDAMQGYVEHEQFVRTVLDKFKGQRLNSWKRDFILTAQLRPTRAGVIGRDIDRQTMGKGWLLPNRLHINHEKVKRNRVLFDRLVSSWSSLYGTEDPKTFFDDYKDLRTGSPKNLVIPGVPLRDLLNDFLLSVEIADIDDSSRLTATSLLLATHLEKDANALTNVVLIGEMRRQTRTCTSEGRINQIFSGKSPNTNVAARLRYVGDEKIRSQDRITVHLRTFDLRPDEKAAVNYPDVRWFSMYLPEQFRKSAWIEKKAV